MRIYKPKFWDKRKSILSILLYPFALFYFAIIVLRKILSKRKKFNLHIICIGNIYVGGTGKTPLSILLGNELLKKNKKPVIVRKFYKNHADEHRYIEENFEKLILNKNRVKAIFEAERTGYQTVILDDGAQDYSIHKDLSIICFNQNQLIGNGFVFPSGPLRENVNALKDTQIIVINGKKDSSFEEMIMDINKNIKIFYSHYKPININEFKNKDLLALAGIANPENFFNLLIKNECNLVKKLIYPDHYIFSKNEILKIIDKANRDNLKIIMTEKDFFKIKDFNLSDINYLKVNLVIEKKEELINQILNIYD